MAPPTTYTYDGDGLRATKNVGGAVTFYAWDLAEGTPLLLSEGGNGFVYGPGGAPLEQYTSGRLSLYYHQDQLGSTRLLTDDYGYLMGTYTYGAYGTLTASSGPEPTSLVLDAVDNPLGYAGQYTDAETGFQYLRNRYYDPATAQFLNRDPIEAVTRSAYGYVGGNPLNATDPTGLNKCEAGWNPGRWIGNAADCASKVQPSDAIRVGMDAVLPGSGEVAAHSTMAVCVNGNLGALIGAAGSVCIGQSHLREFGFVETFGGGYQTPAAGIGVEGMISDAHHLRDLGGPFTYGGGSVGPFQADYQWGNDACGNHVHVLAGGLGRGWPGVPGVEGHFGWNRSRVQQWTL